MNAVPDLVLAQRSSSSYGVFTLAHALEAGHSRRMIRRRLGSGAWLSLHPLVYCFASTPRSWFRDEIAACYWSRGSAAGRAAGFLHELPGCEDPPIEVITTERHRAMPMNGVVVRVTNRLPEQQITMVKNIPATSIERTLMSLCGQFGERRSAIALDNALYRGLTTVGNIDLCLYLTARQGRNGCKVLRELMKKRVGLDEVANTPLESVIFELIANSELDMPLLQHEIYDQEGRFVARPDFVYRAEKIAIEGHSKLWHTGVQAEAHDRGRHARLLKLGYEVVYVTWSDATRYGSQTLNRVDTLLSQRRQQLLIS